MRFKDIFLSSLDPAGQRGKNAAFSVSVCLAVVLLAGSASYAAYKGALLRIPVERSKNGSAPNGWKIKEWKGKAHFEVTDTEIGKTIHLKSRATSSALYRDVKFDIREFPYLSWKWKVTELPKGADVRKRTSDDQAVQVYVIFPRWPAAINSRVIGYIWDTNAPAGSTHTSTKSSNTKYIVLKSGDSAVGKWSQENRNVYEDYRRSFNEDPPGVGSISVMIDSDDTSSSAESFVGDIYFSREISQAKNEEGAPL